MATADEQQHPSFQRLKETLQQTSKAAAANARASARLRDRLAKLDQLPLGEQQARSEAPSP